MGQNVEKLRKTGDVVAVRKGYARNYLFPKRMVMKYTKEIEEMYEKKRAEEVARKEVVKQEAISLQKSLEVVGKYNIVKKAEDDKLFGSVSQADVAAAIRLQT